MANAKSLYRFSSGEINFLAEQELVTILPRYTMNGATLIGARLPDLKALRREEVPLWLALILKKQDKCNIVIPEWLTVNFLKKKYEEEMNQPNKFSDLPWQWLPISKMVLDKSSDDFIDPPHEIRSILQDLREIRQLKARKGIKELNEVYLQLDGLSLVEINEIRPLIVESMNQLRILSQSVKADQLSGAGDSELAEKGGMVNESQATYEQDASTTRDSIKPKADSSLYDSSVGKISVKGNTTTSDDSNGEGDSDDSDVEYRK
ncbi:hypothetical protein FOA43_000663 [Brettanomyces nanus]|uniref:DNA replication complex GINS protein PSF2 n=1 Tax=Eeniella nana TaxID=13502 RepID=A0A875RXR5_EENNA|nr:uncharacterized protein FOA43_000663 [Brettanomyces nanus]QPG73353.1 hypothetical protein FOA43_000663 [Brettanomyces nanus]